MMNITLELVAKKNLQQKVKRIKLHEEMPSFLFDSAQEDATVYYDWNYSGKIEDESVRGVTKVYINDLYIPTTFKEGELLFSDGTQIFHDCYGVAQISIELQTDDGPRMLHSGYLQVMVHDDEQNDSVRRMAEFVGKNNDLLYGDGVLPDEVKSFRENEQKTLESKLKLLKDISQIFEDNYRYFKSNSRYTTIPRENIDSFEKLRFISAKTVQYIAQHPEELYDVGEVTGVKILGRNYHPRKTLITSNVPSYNIYENQYIVSFLRYIIKEVCDVEQGMRELKGRKEAIPKEEGEYVPSSKFIYGQIEETLTNELKNVQELVAKYKKLYSAYKQILPVETVSVKGRLRPTAIFRAVPQYRHIYEGMVKWFCMEPELASGYKYLLYMLRGSDLYEAYVLSKLICHFRNNGYALAHSEKKPYKKLYGLSEKAFYKDTDCKNYFLFEKENSSITVYYQPIVHTEDKSRVCGIGLYRNTTIPFPKDLDDDRSSSGDYYTPDFIIKHEVPGAGAKYCILDAKFSEIERVKKNSVAALAYKYLFSITTTDNEDSIVSLCIVNGKSKNENDTVEDIRNKTKVGTKISPAAEILTLTENKEGNTEEHFELLKQVLCYLSQ